MPEERKLVTILFADTADSTALGETLDPEDVRALMAGYYDHAQRAIVAHGGTLEKFIGDAVMAVFGLPTAHSNDAERALAAALALFRAVAEDAVLAGRIVLRAGVHTGEVVASSDLARGDFLVTGDAVNVAARLEQAADPGEIVTSERTADAARASFLFGAARSLTVKGKSRPLRVYPLTGQRPLRALGHPPLVGRKTDLAQLALLAERALAERRPQLVSIVAPAGTGKTRLLEEFLAHLRPNQGWQIATARCLPYGQTLTYWPLRGLLEELLGAALTPISVSDAFAAAGHPQDDANRLAGQVMATLGIAPDGGAERETIFGAWRLLIEALARQAPRIVVFEDLHWASESLLDLVEHLMQPRTEAALLLAATSRPELLDRRSAWGGGRRCFTALSLEPLTNTETRTLVGKLAKKLPEATRERVVERAGGNPFFVIEMARALAERNLAGATTTPDTLPDTVQEALQEQIDQLSRPERTALQAASVAGRTFRPATLHAVLDLPAPAEPVAIDAALDSLLARDLIAPAEESGAYTFRHILVRDVAYGTLARAERARLHLAVAAWLERFAAGRVDEFVELIAYHHREAALLARQSAVPLNIPVDIERAVHFLERAGEAAARAGAILEARHHLEHAIELAAMPDHLRLYETLGDCEYGLDSALTAYRQALACWRSEVAPAPLVGARLLRKQLGSIMRWWALTPWEGSEEVLALRAEAWRLVEAADDEYERWRLRAVELFWPEWSGEPVPEQVVRAQVAVGLESAANFEACGDWAAFSETLDGAGTCAKIVGDFATRLAAAQRRLATPVLPAIERGDAFAMLVAGQAEAGDYAGALETAHTGLAARRPGEPTILLSKAASEACFAAYYSGRWFEIAPFAAIINEAWEEYQYGPALGGTVGWAFVILLRVALAQNDRSAIERAAAAIERLLLPNNPPDLGAWFEASLHDDPAPLQAFLRSVATSDDIRAGETSIMMFLNEHGLTSPPALLDLLTTVPWARFSNLTRCLTPIAQALAADDNTRLAAAIDDAETHGLIPHAARMRIVLAQRTSDPAPLDLARPVLERLGDRQFLRRLDEVAASLPPADRI